MLRFSRVSLIVTSTIIVLVTIAFSGIGFYFGLLIAPLGGLLLAAGLAIGYLEFLSKKDVIAVGYPLHNKFLFSSKIALMVLGNIVLGIGIFTRF